MLFVELQQQRIRLFRSHAATSSSPTAALHIRSSATSFAFSLLLCLLLPLCEQSLTQKKMLL